MRLIDADSLLKSLEETKNEILKTEDSFEKTLTISMILFAETIIEKFAERSDTRGSSG